MAIVGGGGQAELATVHERQAMPVPDALDWPEAGGTPEVFTTALRRDLHPGRAARGRAPARPRRRRRRRHRRRPARRRRRRARDRDRPAPRGARRRGRELGAHEVLDPEGFEEHGPFDVILELVGAPNLGATSRRSRTGAHRRHRHRGRREGRAQPPRPHVRSARRSAPRRCGPARSRRRRCTARAMERHVAAAVRGGRAARPGRRDVPARVAPPRPTTGSPRAARSARSCWFRRRMNAAERLWRALGGPRLGRGELAVPAERDRRLAALRRQHGRRGVRRHAARAGRHAGARSRAAGSSARAATSSSRAPRRRALRRLLRPARRPDRGRGRVLGR